MHDHGAAVRERTTAIGPVMGTLSARWGVPIVEAVHRGADRFNALLRAVPGISHKVLTDTLRTLQRDGFVTGPLRDPRRSEYALTPLGHDLVALIDRLRDWSADREPEIARARAEYDDHRGGKR